MDNETVRCAYCGLNFRPDQLIDFNGVKVCAGCKPFFVQRFVENAETSTPSSLNYAGFGIRFGATFIDGIITSIINYAVFIPLFKVPLTPVPNATFMDTLIPEINSYFVVMQAFAFLFYVIPLGIWGATPGKMICGLKVVRSNGNPISWGTAIGRYFGNLVSTYTLFIGYLMVAFDKEQHRALHDRICDTRVIKTRE